MNVCRKCQGRPRNYSHSVLIKVSDCPTNQHTNNVRMNESNNNICIIFLTQKLIRMKRMKEKHRDSCWSFLMVMNQLRGEFELLLPEIRQLLVLHSLDHPKAGNPVDSGLNWSPGSSFCCWRAQEVPSEDGWAETVSSSLCPHCESFKGISVAVRRHKRLNSFLPGVPEIFYINIKLKVTDSERKKLLKLLLLQQKSVSGEKRWNSLQTEMTLRFVFFHSSWGFGR